MITDWAKVDTNRKPSIKSEVYQGLAFIVFVIGSILLYAFYAHIRAAS
jgi:hypothetical protein